MPRATRFLIENGIYHVINRGAARRHIFLDDTLKQIFLILLDETQERYNFIIHAYCIMGNHYHLVIETPDANLSDGMRHLNSRFASEFNKLRRKDGPIFKSRFKSIYISNKKYLQTVIRYIHLNPVNAHLVNNAEDYEWSSCKYYLTGKTDYSFLVQKSSKIGKQSYASYLAQGNPVFIKDFYNRSNLKTIL